MVAADPALKEAVAATRTGRSVLNSQLALRRGKTPESALGVALPGCFRSRCVIGPGLGLGAQSRRSWRPASCAQIRSERMLVGRDRVEKEPDGDVVGLCPGAFGSFARLRAAS